MDDEAKIEYYLNECWNGKGWSPYDLLTIGECLFATRQTARHRTHPDAEDNARDYRAIVLDKARQRWMQGFYSDPFCKEPRKRK